ncbi:MAG: S-layer homology domain-containing protein [Lachnospiraceae bacterium]
MPTAWDVGQNSWYRSYVGWAARRGLVNGYDGGRTFKPESSILDRVCSVDCTSYGLLGLRTAARPDRKFSDANDIPGGLPTY